MTARRKLRILIYSALGTLVLLPSLVLALDRYTRQLFFGPKIRDVPFCAWQRSFRHYATDGVSSDDALTKALTRLGVRSPNPEPWPWHQPDMVPVLLSLVDDSDRVVRCRVADELGILPSSTATEAALIRLMDDPHPRVRTFAAIAFGNLKDASDAPLPKLRERMDDESQECRVHA